MPSPRPDIRGRAWTLDRIFFDTLPKLYLAVSIDAFYGERVVKERAKGRITLSVYPLTSSREEGRSAREAEEAEKRGEIKGEG